MLAFQLTKIALAITHPFTLIPLSLPISSIDCACKEGVKAKRSGVGKIVTKAGHDEWWI